MDTKNIPVFTTSRPGFMASTEDRNQEFIDEFTGDRTLADKAKGISVYIDGELEDILGYDVPIWLSGDITGDDQTVYVWNVEGNTRYTAKLTWGHSETFSSHGYIRLPRKEL